MTFQLELESLAGKNHEFPRVTQYELRKYNRYLLGLPYMVNFLTETIRSGLISKNIYQNVHWLWKSIKDLGYKILNSWTLGLGRVTLNIFEQEHKWLQGSNKLRDNLCSLERRPNEIIGIKPLFILGPSKMLSTLQLSHSTVPRLPEPRM